MPFILNIFVLRKFMIELFLLLELLFLALSGCFLCLLLRFCFSAFCVCSGVENVVDWLGDFIRCFAALCSNPLAHCAAGAAALLYAIQLFLQLTQQGVSD